MRVRLDLLQRWGWTILAAMAVASAAGAQEDVRSMALSQIYESATHRVNARNFEEAIPYLSELVDRLGDAEEQAAWKVLDYAMFHLALAYMESERYDRATRGFQAYLKRFPEGVYRQGAHLLWAESYAAQEKWPDVVRIMTLFLRDPLLKSRERNWGNQLVGEAWFRQEQWDRAVDPLAYVFKNAFERDVRNQAAVQMTTALVRLERFDDLFTVIPFVYRTSARYNIALNLALVEAGDKNYEAERFLYAISLYRLVFFKHELIENFTLNLEAAERDRKLVWQEKGLDRTRMVALSRKLGRQIKDYNAQRARIRDLPDYDEQIMIRLAQTYLNLQRYWEALTQFRRVFDERSHHPLAEQALYSAFATAREMGNADRAIKEGYDYLDAYPLGEHWDALTVDLAQLHIQRKEYELALDVAGEALELKPDHPLRPHLLYLMGYSHFQLNRMPNALARFEEILTRHPDCAFVEDASYWRALTELFLLRYTESRVNFTNFLTRFSDSGYLEDASFRLGVAYYGEGDFTRSHDVLRQFVSDYPESALVGEAYCMLGDIRASWSQLDAAIADYSHVPGTAANMTEINYALFQSCRVYELEKRYDDIIRICRGYIEKYPETANIPQATYWIGNAFLRSGRLTESFDAFFDAIVEYGNEPENIGIDMILRDVIADQQALQGTDSYPRFLKRLYREMEDAHTEEHRTLYLRLTTLFAETQPEGGNRRKLHTVLVREKDLDRAGPLTLLVIGREAADRGDAATSRAAYQAVLGAFGESDFRLDALWALAGMAMAEQAYDEADAYAAQILERYPTLPTAGEAQKMRGDLLRMQGRWGEAIEAYTTLLGVRDWRGPLFPEALYWIGVSHLEQDRPQEAFAHFQRVYVLYGAHPSWVAKAYLQSAESLVRLDQKPEALSTLRELLSDPNLAGLPEGDAARERLAQWEEGPG